jgi:hypothetical protein
MPDLVELAEQYVSLSEELDRVREDIKHAVLNGAAGAPLPGGAGFRFGILRFKEPHEVRIEPQRAPESSGRSPPPAIARAWRDHPRAMTAVACSNPKVSATSTTRSVALLSGRVVEAERMPPAWYGQ